MDIKADLVAPLTRVSAQAAAVTPAVAASRVESSSVAPVQALPPVSDSLASAAVAGMGVYIDRPVSDGVPKWEVMTALRAYGLNLDDKAPEPVADTRKTEAVASRADRVPVERQKDNPKVETRAQVDKPVIKVEVEA